MTADHEHSHMNNTRPIRRLLIMVIDVMNYLKSDKMLWKTLNSVLPLMQKHQRFSGFFFRFVFLYLQRRCPWPA